jgi:hypothetical protein
VLAEIAVHDKGDRVHDAHFTNHGQKPDICLAQTGTAADHVQGQVGHRQIVLNHGQMQRVGRIAALTVSNLHPLTQTGPVDFQLDILEVDGQGVVADKIAMLGKAPVFENNGPLVRFDQLPDPIVPLQTAIQKHTAGAAGVVGDQLVGGQIVQGRGNDLTVPFPSDVERLRLPGLTGGRQKHRRLIDFPVHLIPAFQVEDGPQIGSDSHPGDNGGHHAGAAFQVVSAKEGVDEGTFTGLDGPHHGHTHGLLRYLLRNGPTGVSPSGNPFVDTFGNLLGVIEKTSRIVADFGELMLQGFVGRHIDQFSGSVTILKKRGCM